MKIYIVHIGNLLLCPPVLNLINMLEEMRIETRVISTKTDTSNWPNYKYIENYQLDLDYESPRNIVKKMTDMVYYRKQIWDYIEKDYTNNDVIWITSNTAIKHIGGKITEKNYVLQLMELSENLNYHKYFPIKLDAHKIGNSALAVVVPEYNRAHITKAWWNLEKTPLILSNKPYVKEAFVKNNEVHNEIANEVIRKLEGKKIILYQGIIHKERPLDQYIYAVDKLGEDYAFVVMSSGENVYKDIESSNYYFIPYIKAPMHLEITSHAYIGVLSYFPVKTDYSILNALYCAPNKTFEYAMFGVPMIGNDNPGLKYLFETTNSGVSVEEFTVDEIIRGIKNIEENYDLMSRNAVKYYNDIDTKKQLQLILDKVKERM